jgi:hypothetical protein
MPTGRPPLYSAWTGTTTAEGAGAVADGGAGGSAGAEDTGSVACVVGTAEGLEGCSGLGFWVVGAGGGGEVTLDGSTATEEMARSEATGSSVVASTEIGSTVVDSTAVGSALGVSTTVGLASGLTLDGVGVGEVIGTSGAGEAEEDVTAGADDSSVVREAASGAEDSTTTAVLLVLPGIEVE